jgi:hypothetical protein
MSKFNLEIEDMRRRLEENARNEQSLLKALNEALSQTDEKLLSEVRHVTAQHEARRIAILNELQLLAARLCTFPVGRAEPLASIGEEVVRELEDCHTNGKAHAPGDWRLAARNIADDIDYYLRGQGLNH